MPVFWNDSISGPSSQNDDNFSKALNRFQREDPTFRVMYDAESREVCLFQSKLKVNNMLLSCSDNNIRNGRAPS